MSLPAPAGPLLLYDGACGLCADSVRMILRHDRAGTLRFAALQGSVGASIRAAHPELEGVDSVVWVEPAVGGARRVLTRSSAVLRAARYLGGWWSLARVGVLVPRPLRDAVYDIIARHRHRLRVGAPACLVPPPEVRARFLD